MSLGRICIREVDTAEPNEMVYVTVERMLAQEFRQIGRLLEQETPRCPA